MSATHSNRSTTPTWREVVRSTLRTHRSDVMVLALTAVFVVAFAVAGYALVRYGVGS